MRPQRSAGSGHDLKKLMFCRFMEVIFRFPPRCQNTAVFWISKPTISLKALLGISKIKAGIQFWNTTIGLAHHLKTSIRFYHIWISLLLI